MKARVLHDDGQQRTLALVFETGDRVMELLLAYAKSESLSADTSPLSVPEKGDARVARWPPYPPK